MPSSKLKKRHTKIILVNESDATPVPLEQLDVTDVVFIRLTSISDTVKCIAANDIAMVVVTADAISQNWTAAIDQLTSLYQHRKPPIWYWRIPKTSWVAISPQRVGPPLDEISSLAQVQNVLDALERGSRNYLDALRIESSGYNANQCMDDYKDIVDVCPQMMKSAMDQAAITFSQGDLVKTRWWIHKMRSCTTLMATERADKAAERLEKKSSHITSEKLANLGVELEAAIESARLYLRGMNLHLDGH